MQDAIDAEAHAALPTTRFDVDVTGALVEGVLEQPVNDVHHMSVVSVGLLITGAEVQQLLEIAGSADLLIIGSGAADRLGQAVELNGKALQVDGIGHHPLDRSLEHMGEVGFPTFHERLAAGDGHCRAVDRHREDLVPLGEGVGHQRGDRRDVDLQRIDTQIGLPGLFGEPDGQCFEIQLLAGASQVIDLLSAEKFQRMLLAVCRTAPQGHALLGRFLRQPPLRDQVTQQVIEVEEAILGRRIQHGHGLFGRGGYEEQACR